MGFRHRKAFVSRFCIIFVLLFPFVCLLIVAVFFSSSILQAVRWCKESVVPVAVVGVTGSQAICCQRLLSVVTENLAMLQRWEKKGG